MKLRTDSQRRLYGRDVLNLNSIYEAEREGERIVLVELKPAEPRIVRARKINGRWKGAALKLNRETVAAAVRAGRDER